MKKRELLDICYKYFNRYINANELLEKLKNLKGNKNVNLMIDDITKITIEEPNKEDEYVIKKKENMKKLMDKLDSIPKGDSELAFVEKSLNGLKRDYEKEIDSHDRWFKIVDYINRNDYFNKLMDSLSDYEFLEFICQNICAPFPPNLDQEEFDKLVKVAIEKDEREYLWRLAFNYEKRNMNFDKIVDYFIEVKDAYYLCELISAVGECLDIDKMIDKITDKELIDGINERKDIIKNYVSSEQFERLNNKDK